MCVFTPSNIVSNITYGLPVKEKTHGHNHTATTSKRFSKARKLCIISLRYSFCAAIVQSDDLSAVVG